jgi:glycosyltransferase involved in cell wall biosynthesis
MKLSAVLIAHNEEANLEECVQSVALADECIVVEHGSTDRTPEIAARLGVRFEQTGDWPGFGLQKNRALDLAQGDWVLSLDADERVTPGLMAEVMAAISSGRSDAYEIPRRTQFCGSWIYHCGWSPDHVLRLFKRGSARFSPDKVHEKLVMNDPAARVGRLQQPLLHYSYPTPHQYWQKLQRYSHDWACQRHARGQNTTIARAALSGLAAFVKSYFFRLGFLDGAMGFVVCAMQGQAAFGKYFELYWLNRQDEK